MVGVRVEPLMTTTMLKQRFLLGVDLTLDDGSSYPDDLFEYSIRSACSILEHELDIFITPITKEENSDYYSANYSSWNYVQLDSYPIIGVTKWEVTFPGDNVLFEYPKSWIRIEKDKGLLQIFPSLGEVPQWMTNLGFMPWLLVGHQNIPHYYRITYEAGFETDKIPIIINEAIGLIAAALPLDIAGDLLVGAGIANSSISIDSLSQSIGTTSSATNAGYGAKIISFNKRLKSIMTTLRGYYKGIIFDSM